MVIESSSSVTKGVVGYKYGVAAKLEVGQLSPQSAAASAAALVAWWRRGGVLAGVAVSDGLTEVT